ncbi:MAG: hypothetical protein D6704_05450 [Nitrospirae bacterium]|nr:MAG: hypothetical protein D6704_05450 [Nitrospirota bacterium]
MRKKLILFVFRRSLEETVKRLLGEMHVGGYTIMHTGVTGRGETGEVSGTFEAPGENAVLLLTLDEETSVKVCEKFKEFHNSSEARFKVPLRLFVLPCEQIL